MRVDVCHRSHRTDTGHRSAAPDVALGPTGCADGETPDAAVRCYRNWRALPGRNSRAMISRIPTFTAIAMIALVLAGCSSNSTLKPPAGYPKLVVSADEPNTLVFVKPGLDLSGYRKIWIEPVRVRAQGLAEAEVKDAEAQELAAYTREAFTRALAKRFEVASAAAPDVLRIRLTITDLQPTGAAQAIMMVPPFSMVNMVSPKGAFLGSITLGGEFFEGDATPASLAFLAYRSRPGIDATVAFGRWTAVRKVVDNAAERLARDLSGQK